MKLLKYILPIVAVAGFSASTAVAKGNGYEINERDLQAVKQHLKTKRDMRLSDKHDDLNISGDVRWSMDHYSEETKVNGVKFKERSNDDTTTNCGMFGTTEFDVEFNLYFDYTAERTWAHVHLEFDNAAGIDAACPANTNYNNMGGSFSSFNEKQCGTGTCDQLCLRSAYFGYNVFEEGSSRLDAEVGRWDMYSIFDSRVQFQNRYDGLLLTYSNSFEDIGDFYVKGGMFVVDSVASNWGYAVEAGLIDIVDLGIDFKYSYTDYKKKADRCGNTTTTLANTGTGSTACARSWLARISQFSGAYHFNPEMVNEDIKLYGAFLINHSAEASNNTNATSKKENKAYYFGGMIGGIQGEGDWAIDANYQCVEAQALPGFAVSGIGMGNVYGNCFHMSATSNATSGTQYLGNTNYSGFAVEGGYALTDNLVMTSKFRYSSESDKASANAERSYWMYGSEMVYSF